MSDLSRHLINIARAGADSFAAGVRAEREDGENTRKLRRLIMAADRAIAFIDSEYEREALREALTEARRDRSD